VIIVAILINFSLFATSLVIDASNVIAIAFYEAIASGAVQEGGKILGNTGLSGAFMDKLKLTTIFDAGVIDMEGIITIAIMGSILMLVASFVFFAAALMFIIRYVVLILVLILSPIAFVAMVFPGLNSQAKKWREAL